MNKKKHTNMNSYKGNTCEQMKQVDVTNKMMYTESNLKRVNEIRMKMVKTREEATRLHI